MQRDLSNYTDEQLYDELDKIGVKKARLPQIRDQYTQYTRNCYKAEQAQIKAELKRRGLPVTRPGDTRVYGPGQARWQKTAA